MQSWFITRPATYTKLAGIPKVAPFLQLLPWEGLQILNSEPPESLPRFKICRLSSNFAGSVQGSGCRNETAVGIPASLRYVVGRVMNQLCAKIHEDRNSLSRSTTTTTTTNFELRRAEEPRRSPRIAPEGHNSLAGFKFCRASDVSPRGSGCRSETTIHLGSWRPGNVLWTGS